VKVSLWKGPGGVDLNEYAKKKWLNMDWYILVMVSEFVL
jgi:hypothetical protein